MVERYLECRAPEDLNGSGTAFRGRHADGTVSIGEQRLIGFSPRALSIASSRDATPIAFALILSRLINRTAAIERTRLRSGRRRRDEGLRGPRGAVAIVHDDKVIYLKGFGVRKLGEKEPVTADTVFAIASCSKAFTATGIAMLVAEGKMKWDDPVRKHVEWFHLSDPSADRDVTIRDLLCHRTGMPRHDALWASAPNSPEEYIRAFGKAKPSTSFRSTWIREHPLHNGRVASGTPPGPTGRH